MFRGESEADDSSSSSADSDPETGSLQTSSDISQINIYVSKLSGIQIQLKQDKLRGIAFQLWPAAILLVDYLEEKQNLLFPAGIQHESFIELGAGIGLCGLFVAALGSPQVVLTDTEEAMGILGENIAINNPQTSRKVSASVLRWGEEEDFRRNFASFASPPIVLASDCVYWEHLFEPFYQTLLRFVSAGSTVLISHVKRWKKDTKFFAMCAKTMKVEVLVENVAVSPDCTPRRNISRIYKITKS